MKITPCGALPTARGSAGYFTGTVWAERIIIASEPARANASRVSFEPGARTAWHTHPLGQTLYVLSGCGRVQLLGEPVREIKAGDSVWIAPGEKHWHGAAPTTAMTHLAMHETLDGEYADWMEKVTDEDYNVLPG
jgi:quercetin dioxygenase-like cupin family protein